MQSHSTSPQPARRAGGRGTFPWLRAGAVLALAGQLLGVAPVVAAPDVQINAQANPPAAADQDIVENGKVVGHYYTQTGGGTGKGYDVREPYYSAMMALGGPTITGYPVSIPFQATDGCQYQDFQVVLLQQCGNGPVQRANTFQIMEVAGVDDVLLQKGIGKGESDSGAAFEESKKIRLNWLEDAAIKDRYLSQCGNGDADAAVQFCGLPMNHPANQGPFISQRFQRIAFLRWQVEGPGGIKAGDISPALGGDLLKETGIITGAAVQPQAMGQVPPPPTVDLNSVAGAAPAAQTGQAGPNATFGQQATLGIVQNPVEAAPKANPDSFAPGAEGQDLTTGDVVRTNANGDGLITYYQGTTTEVLPGTRVIVDQIATAPQGGPLVVMRQLAGTAISRVAKMVNGGSFTIQTPNATAVVRGTIVRSTVLPNGGTRIEVWEGAADFTAAGQTVQVQAGQFSEAAPGQAPTPPAQNTTPQPPSAPPPTIGAAGAATATPGATPTASATPTPAPTVVAARTQPLNYGFQGDFFNSKLRPQAINLIKDAGFGWAKQQVPWVQYEIQQSDCQANKNNCLDISINGNQHYFAKDQVGYLDAVINDLNGAGLRIMLSIVHAPSFMAAVPGANTPGDPNRLRDFAQFLASRYKGKVNAIETWNEQNLSWEWGNGRLWPNAPAAPPQGVVDFVQLQKAAYQGVKAGDSNITVVLPALTPTGLGECWLNEEARNQGFCLDAVKTAIDDRLYLDFMYQVNNGEIKNYYDVLGVHPSGYNNPPDDWTDKKTVPTENFKGHGSFYIKRYQQLHDVQVKYGDNKPMWFTEVGWSSTNNVVPGYEYGHDNTEAQRGKYFARLLEQVQKEAPYVTNMFVWNLNFREVVGENDEKYGFGVVNPDGSPLPAYTCMKDFVRNNSTITRAECKS